MSVLSSTLPNCVSTICPFLTDLADCSKFNGENYFPIMVSNLEISLKMRQEFIKIYITDYTVLKLFSVDSQLSVDGQ